MFYTGNEGDITWFCNNTVTLPSSQLVFYTNAKTQETYAVRGRTRHLSFFGSPLQGFMWEAAEELGAMLVFAEHRYYGESLPFGKDSYRVSVKAQSPSKPHLDLDECAQ